MSKPTHILISIFSLEERIQRYKDFRDSNLKEYDKYSALISELETLKCSEKLTKQISLSEEDIEKKAQILIDLAPEPEIGTELCAYFEGFREGCQQALKDLL